MPWTEPPTVPAGEQPTLAQPHEIRYLCSDAFTGSVIEELPLTGVTFELGLGQAGTLEGALDVEDPDIQQMSWIEATGVNKTGMWVDIDGGLAWGGITTEQTYTLSKGQVSLHAQEHYYYFGQRLQAADYGAVWASTPVPATTIALQVMSDALAVPGSLPLAVVVDLVDGAVPEEFWIPFSAPLSQRLTVDMIVRELSSMGYLVSYDFASDPSYVAGLPTAQLTLSYPRRGNTAPDPPLVMDVSDCIDFVYDVSGSQQANGMIEMLSGSGGVSGEAFYTPAFEQQGWPLLEAVGSHSSMSSIPVPDSVVEAYLVGDLALRAYPQTVVTITYPLFNDAGLGTYPQWGDWQVGDDVLLVLPSSSAFPANPRFPDGLYFIFRIVKASVKIADEGVSTVEFTLNVPPLTTPILPPGV